MPDTTLDQRREQMIRFLLENIVAREIKRVDSDVNDVVFTDKGERIYYLKTLSKPADFPYEFEKDPKSFDNDRKRLDTISKKVAAFIIEKNSQGFIPGFVLLRADTDYHQIKGERTGHYVNHGSFLKQNLSPYTQPKPGFDNRVLSPLELVLLQFYRRNEENSGKGRFSRGQAYYPELIYFNTKEGVLEVVWFADVADPSKFKLKCCPFCHNPNGKEYNHEACREDPDYTDYVLRRERARYSKLIRISRTRGRIDGRYETEAKKGVRFKPTTVGGTTLYLPEKQNIAVVK